MEWSPIKIAAIVLVAVFMYGKSQAPNANAPPAAQAAKPAIDLRHASCANKGCDVQKYIVNGKLVVANDPDCQQAALDLVQGNVGSLIVVNSKADIYGAILGQLKKAKKPQRFNCAKQNTPAPAANTCSGLGCGGISLQKIVLALRDGLRNLLIQLTTIQ